MPRIRLLSAAVLLGLAANAAQAQTFSGVISFGDSLSDAGNYAPLIPGAGSFTTNPDDVWTQILASSYGYTQTAFTVGGTNFAWGGAPTGSIAAPGPNPFIPGPGDAVPGVPFPLRCVPTTLPCQSVGEQLFTYLNGNTVDPNALYTYWAGANDIFNYLGAAGAGLITGAQAQQFTGASAVNAVGQVGALQLAGANYIVVLNLPDIGRTPAFLGTPGATSVTGLILIYNQTLNAGLGQLGDGIIPVNTFGLFNEILANPNAYGFTNVTGTACNLALTGGSSLFCTPGAYVSPDANQTFAFADGVHPTGAAHRLIAQAVQAEIAAPGQVSMLGEMALKAAEDHDASLRGQIMNGIDRDRGDDSVRGFADLHIGNIDFSATDWTPESDVRQLTLTAGADHRITSNWRWGGAVSFSNQDIDVGTADIDGKAVSGSLFVAYDFDHGYVAATVSGGNDSFDIDRHIQLGTLDRVETGSTDASRVALSLGGAWMFGEDNFRHGPFADVTWQQVDVDGFSEDSGDSTAMTFDEYDRDSLVARVGYQLMATSGHIRPYGRIAYHAENEDDQVFVRAGLVTLNGHFVMPGWQPSDNWWTAEVGVAFEISDSLVAHVAYSGLFADDTQDRNTLNIGVRKDFGTAREVVEEPVAVETAPDCSALDDDGDGVNNCNDTCPGSAAGQPIGPDGCAVPAAEPVMEAKPFRG
ncbi:MAG: autotransporter domain-containing protein [Arenimonas sp.]